MSVFNGMFPIVKGKEGATRAFAAEVAGPRQADFRAHHARANTTRETWTIQETPMGSFLLVWFEGDIEKAFGDHATHPSEFTAWFRAKVLEVTGVDLGAPPQGPLPDVLVDWRK